MQVNALDHVNIIAEDLHGTARFYADHLLVKAGGLRDSIVDGADCVTALALDAF